MASITCRRLAHRRLESMSSVESGDIFQKDMRTAMSKEKVCAAMAAGAAKKSDLDVAMEKALNVIEDLMSENEKEWGRFEMQDVYRSVRTAMEAFEEAQCNLLIEVGELAITNGQDESAAMYAEAKRIQPVMHPALLAKGTFEC